MNGKFSEYERDKIIKLHKEGLLTTQIAAKIGRSQSGVERFLKREGYKLNSKRILKDDDFELIRRLYENGLTCVDIYNSYFSDKFKSSAVIEKYIRDIGISRGRYSKESIVNHNYFKNIDCERKAYWLGLLMADGCVLNPKGNSWCISLELSTKDSYLIYEMIKDMESDKSMRNYKRKKSKSHKNESETSVITIYSHQLVEDLGRYGIVQRKSRIDIPLPNIDKDLLRHYIRGYFDGDGSVMKSKCKDQRLSRYGISICGTSSFLYGMKEILDKSIKCNATIIDMNKYGVNIFNLRLSNNADLYNFYKYIYADATIYMVRKKNRLEEFMNERNIEY